MSPGKRCRSAVLVHRAARARRVGAPIRRGLQPAARSARSPGSAPGAMIDRACALVRGLHIARTTTMYL